MNLQKSFIISLATGLILASCSSGEKKVVEEKVVVEEVQEAAPHEGFATLNELTESFISTIKDNDYDEYVSHVMTRQEEHNQSKKIKDDKVRHAFLDEFDFSLKEEEIYFKNMIHYLEENKLDLHKLEHDETLIVEFNENKYAPVELKEVIIPFIHDEIENDLVFIAIKIGDRWFLTSELIVSA